MEKTKKRNAITRTKQVLQNKRQKTIEQSVIAAAIAATPIEQRPQGWTRSKIKMARQHLQNPQNMAPDRLAMIERQLASYERNKVSSRKSSQTYGDILTILKEEYQTNTDLNTLIASVPITEEQYEEVKQRCNKDYQKSVLKHLKFLMDLHKKTIDLETTIQIALSFDVIDHALDNIGEYENALYANQKKIELFNQEIKQMIFDKVSTFGEEGRKVYTEINTLIEKTLKKDELLRQIQKLKQDKVDILPDGIDKEYLNKAIKYVMLSWSQSIQAETADAELQQLIKKLKDEKKKHMATNQTAKREIDALARRIETSKIEDVVKRLSDELEKKICAYQKLAGPKDPITLSQAIIDQHSFRKQQILLDKLRDFVSYVDSKQKLQRQDLLHLEAMFADIKSFEASFKEVGLKLSEKIFNPMIEFRRNMLEIIRNELNFEQEIMVQEENTQTTQSSSASIPEDQTNQTLAFHQQTKNPGQKIRDKLVSQEIGDRIPIIIVHMHGIVFYDDDARCQSYPLGFDVLYRLISAAPYETNQARVLDPKIIHLLGNTILRNSKTTIAEAFDEAKEKLYEPLSFDRTTFRTFENDTDYGATVDKKKRKHFIINYKGTPFCRKLWQLEEKDLTLKQKMGIFVVNQTNPIFNLPAGMNLLEKESFVHYCKTVASQGVKYETKNGKESITSVGSYFLYDYLKRKGFKQVILIDGSCESPFIKNPAMKLRPTNDQSIIEDIKYLNANINYDSKTGNLLARLYHKKFLRNPDYKINHTNSVIAQNKAKNKSRKSNFSVVNGPNKKTR